MAGIYVHIPFCHSKCHYCNFFSLASRKNHLEIQEALLKELKMRQQEINPEMINSIYFGGGTPSLFPGGFYHKFLHQAEKMFHLSADAEITLEANPEDITESYLDALPERINRISLGIQSFQDRELKVLGRKHSAESSVKALKILNSSRINNISIDLIYGLPGSSGADLKYNFDCLIDFDIQHLSAYALTIEEGTALNYLIRKNKFSAAHDTQYESDFHLMRQLAREAGFQHYEISNFAKIGFEARHNSAYWSGAPYLGLGPSAHSFDGKKRSWNINRISEYLQGINKGKLAQNKEILNPTDRFNELIMTGLRTAKGVCSHALIKTGGKELYDKMLADAAEYLKQGKLIFRDEYLIIPHEFWFLSDRISSDLFQLD